MSQQEQHDVRIASLLARVAQRKGYTQESITTHTPLDDLIAAEERAEMEGGRGDTLAQMLRFFYADGMHPGCVLRRVFAVAKAIKPELVGDMSLEELALMFGETKAAQSWRIKKIFSDYQRQAGVKGFKASFQKSEAAVAAYSRAQRGNKNRTAGKHQQQWKTAA